jgi:hypothetical protein
LVEVERTGHAKLYRYAADGEYCGESWFDSVEAAIDQGIQEFGAAIIGSWQSVPEEEADAKVFAVRRADARRTGPLGPRCDRMTAEEWRRSEDVPAMIRALRAGWCEEGAALVRLVHRYLLASCRAIWPLIPLEASRNGIEVAERWIAGRATRQELGTAEWHAEGAAFFLDPDEFELKDEDPSVREHRIRYNAERSARIASLLTAVEAIPVDELRRLVRMGPKDADYSPRQLLADAAYFADTAIAYPNLRSRVSAIDTYDRFLSAELLREVVEGEFKG